MKEFLFDNANWISSLIVTVVFSIVNLSIAKNNFKLSKGQKELQQNQFCYQLYDKRMKIYDDIKSVLAKIITQGGSDNGICNEFIRCTKDVPMLYGKDIESCVSEIYETINELTLYSKLVNEVVEKSKPIQNHQENCEKQSELLKKLTDISADLEKVFKDYIEFGQFKIVH